MSRRDPRRFVLPPRGALHANSAVDPFRYYYAPLLGRVFAARLELGLALLPRRSRRLLEIGYGAGLLLPTLSRLADVVDGIDLASDPDRVRDDLARLDVRVGDLRRGDATALPFADATYDAAGAFSILEHLGPGDLQRALHEAARVLAPGGVLVVGVPAVHAGMTLAFRAIGFAGIEDHHVSSIHDVLWLARGRFVVEETATLPAGLPLGWAPYNVARLRRA